MESNICFTNRVNGRSIQNHVGKTVRIMGDVIRTNPNMMSVEIMTPDDVKVVVNMKQQLQENITGLVEFAGIVQNRAAISCENYVMFPPEHVVNFDRVAYKEVLDLLTMVPNAFIAKEV